MFNGFFSSNSNNNVLNNLLRVGGLTFFKDYAHSTSSLDADSSVGSKTATFTATRSASAPATYIDANGVIQLTTTSNVGRLQNSYYDSTGNFRQNGLMIEASGTNLFIWTDGTASGSVSQGTAWTGWGNASISTTNTPVLSVVAVPELTSIANATAQRIQYTGVAGDVNAVINHGQSNPTGVGSIVQNDIVTGSIYIKTQTNLTSVSVKLFIFFQDSSGVALDNFNSGSITASIGNVYRKFSFSATADNASTSKATFVVYVDSIDNGDNVDLQYFAPQLEKNPYATSFIPTTTTSLTRGAEILKYATSGNRTASQESVFFKFSSESVFVNDGINRRLLLGDVSTSGISKTTTSGFVSGAPNTTDSATVVANTTTIPQPNVSYIFAMASQHVSPYVTVYMNGIAEGTYTVGDWVTPVLGTNFNVGNNSSQQINGIVQSIAFFNSTLTASQVLQVSNILAGN